MCWATIQLNKNNLAENVRPSKLNSCGAAPDKCVSGSMWQKEFMELVYFSGPKFIFPSFGNFLKKTSIVKSPYLYLVRDWEGSPRVEDAKFIRQGQVR